MLQEQYKIVEVFKTNVTEEGRAAELVALLLQSFPGTKISFDLDDRDKVLRIAGEVCASNVIAILEQQGHECCVLDW